MPTQITNTSPVQRINVEDLGNPKDIPTWVQPLLASLNLFIQSTNSALAGSLQIPTNVTGQFYNTSFTTSASYVDGDTTTFTPITWKSTLPYQASVLLLGSIEIASSGTNYVASNITISDWSDNNGQFSIIFMAGLQPNVTYNIITLAF